MDVLQIKLERLKHCRAKGEHEMAEDVLIDLPQSIANSIKRLRAGERVDETTKIS